LVSKEPIERLNASAPTQILSPPPSTPVRTFTEDSLIGTIINPNEPVPITPSDTEKDLIEILGGVTVTTQSPPTSVPSTTENILSLFPKETMASPIMFGTPTGPPGYPFPMGMGMAFPPSVTPMIPTPMPVPMSYSPMEYVNPPNPTPLNDPAFPPLVVYQSAELTITFYFKKPNPAALQYTLINVVITNNSGSLVVDLSIQAAPPRHAKYLQENISTRNVPPGGTATVVIKAVNSQQGQKPLSMKLRITYTINSQPREIEHVCKAFPADL